MPRHSSNRKARFRAALALAGKTRDQFAAELEISVTHLFMVLTEQRESDRVNSAIDALIAKHLPQHAAVRTA